MIEISGENDEAAGMGSGGSSAGRTVLLSSKTQKKAPTSAKEHGMRAISGQRTGSAPGRPGAGPTTSTPDLRHRRSAAKPSGRQQLPDAAGRIDATGQRIDQRNTHETAPGTRPCCSRDRKLPGKTSTLYWAY
ncbi:MAG TPA: hypothetical protein PLI66_08905, partial [Spirochaetales bacterium]|nr:hypothetical protein [Spirochaetales bacterium]